MIIREQIEHLKEVCERKNLISVIFKFIYQDVNFRGIYFNEANTILVGAEGHNVGWYFEVENDKINTFLPQEVFEKLRPLYKGKIIKTSELCNNMLAAILSLKEDEAEQINRRDLIDIIRKTKGNNSKSDKDHNKPFFDHWRRQPIGKRGPSPENLNKTAACFGYKIKKLCKDNNISSVWTAEPSEKSLNFLNVSNVEDEINNLIK